jgi:hypothetical protein
MSDDVSASFNLPARFVVRVDSVSGEEAEIKVAIGYDQELLLAETQTPFELEFVARGFTALICARDPNEDLSANMWSDVYGQFNKIGGGGGGPTQKLMFSPEGPVYGLSSSAL